MEKELIIPLKEKLISFETAILAKEKGFKNACDWFVNKDNEYIFMPDFLYPNNSEFSYNPEEDPEVIEWEEMMKTLALAPTQSLLQKWLREVHNIIVDVSLDFFNSYTKESIKYSPTFYTYSNNKKRFWLYTDYINSDECTKEMQEEMPIFQNYSTYEEALEIGLQEALKLIKNS